MDLCANIDILLGRLCDLPKFIEDIYEQLIILYKKEYVFQEDIEKCL